VRSRKAHALSLVSSLICAPGSFRETLLARSLPRRVVVGSSNFDNRSFGLNDELNLALPDRERAAHLHEDFERDAALSTPWTCATGAGGRCPSDCWRRSVRWWSGNSRACCRGAPSPSWVRLEEVRSWESTTDIRLNIVKLRVTATAYTGLTRLRQSKVTPVFIDRQCVRRWAARVLLVWLFGVATGMTNACALGEPSHHRTDATAATGSQEHHHVDERGNVGKVNCLDLCEGLSIGTPQLKGADGGFAALGFALPVLCTLSVLSSSEPVVRRLAVDSPNLPGGPPPRIAFQRLAL